MNVRTEGHPSGCQVIPSTGTGQGGSSHHKYVSNVLCEPTGRGMFISALQGGKKAMELVYSTQSLIALHVVGTHK